MSSFHGKTRPDAPRIPQDLLIESFHAFVGNGGGSSGGNNDSRFIAIMGTAFRLTEAQVDAEIPITWNFNFMFVNIQTNGKDGQTLMRLKEDGVGRATIGISAAATGDFRTGLSNVRIAAEAKTDFEFDFTASTNASTMLSRQMGLSFRS